LNLAPDRFGRGEQHRGIDIALQRRLSADPPACVSQVDRPIRPTQSHPVAAICSSHGAPPLVNTITEPLGARAALEPSSRLQ